ncbi:MAG TPA: cohesin domain-containing protein [Steroidobacteraceae bacterium]|jgi:hypothetical protein
MNILCKLAFGLGFAAFLAIVGDANAADLSVVAPASVTAGSEFTVDVNISGAADLYGYQFDLGFNPSVLSTVSVSEGSFLASGGSTFFIPGTLDNVNGSVAATANTLENPVPGVSGSGNLVVVTFEALTNGVSAIAVSAVELIDSAFNSIDSTAISGSVTVASSSVMAPEIDPASTMSAATLLLGALAVLRSRRAAPRRSA